MVVLRRSRPAARSALLLIAVLLVAVFPGVASAAPVTGNATWFDSLGQPYGGCGLPQSQLDSQDFVALNVYDTPGDYNFYPRPRAIPRSACGTTATTAAAGCGSPSATSAPAPTTGRRTSRSAATGRSSPT